MPLAGVALAPLLVSPLAPYSPRRSGVATARRPSDLRRARCSATAASGEAGELSRATLLWRAAKLPIYSVALVPLTVGSASAYHHAGLFFAKRYFILLAAAILVITWLNLSNDVFDSDTGADKNKKESVVNIIGSRAVTQNAAIVSLLLGFAGLFWAFAEAGDARFIFLVMCAIFCGYVYQVRVGTEVGSRIVVVAIAMLYILLAAFGICKALPSACTVLCALTLPVGKLVVDYVLKNHKDNAKIFMAKYYCVRLHAMFGIALASGLQDSNRTDYIENGCSTELVKFCKKWRGNARAQGAGDSISHSAVAVALMNISAGREVRQALAEERIVRVMVNLLDCGAVAKEHAAECLQNMTWSNDGLQRAVVPEGGLRSLLLYLGGSLPPPESAVATHWNLVGAVSPDSLVCWRDRERGREARRGGGAAIVLTGGERGGKGRRRRRE
nr:unnamed protein product [Digitaria exilis]